MSLTLADDVGDVADDVTMALLTAGHTISGPWKDEARRIATERGVTTTLYGTEVTPSHE